MNKTNHSVKVPQIYKAASRIVKTVKESGGSVKDLVYTYNKHLNIKGLYALITKSLHLEDLLNKLIKKSNILTKEKKANPWLVRILVTELLFGKQYLPGESKPVQTVLAYQQQLLTELDKLEKEKDVELNLNQNKGNLPRYIRVNTLMITVKEAISHFCKEGWRKLQLKPDKYSDFLKVIEDIPKYTFLQDFHLDELLIFPKGTAFYDHELYLNGSIILQDKASSLASWLLRPPPGSTVLDMCAAPGMKTTHLAALMKNKGTIFAVERNEKRYNTLCEQIKKYGSSCVKTIHMDALSVDAKQCPNVQYILVDPSCSGSGIIDRPALQSKEMHNASRLNKLAGFQILLLRHALSNFPAVKRVVYSTCSLRCEENEQVVKRVLQYLNTDPLKPTFQLDSSHLQDCWLNYGSSEYNFGTSCFYAHPEVDFTNGFFIAVFKRVNANENIQKNMKRRRHKKKKQDSVAIEGNGHDNNEKENVMKDSLEGKEQLEEKLENKEIKSNHFQRENSREKLPISKKRKKCAILSHDECSGDTRENIEYQDITQVANNLEGTYVKNQIKSRIDTEVIEDGQNDEFLNKEKDCKKRKKDKSKHKDCFVSEEFAHITLEKNYQQLEQNCPPEDQINSERLTPQLKYKHKKRKHYESTENIQKNEEIAVELRENDSNQHKCIKDRTLKKNKQCKRRSDDEDLINTILYSDKTTEETRTLVHPCQKKKEEKTKK